MKGYELKVRIEEEFPSKGGYSLLTSHNGYQWTGGGLLTFDELIQIRDELTNFIDEHNSNL